MRRRGSSRLGRCGAAISTLAFAAGMANAAPAGAIPARYSWSLAGELTIGPPPSLPIPQGASFSAQVDLAAGTIVDGQTSIPTFDRGPATGTEALITLTDVQPSSGSIDAATGQAQIVEHLQASIAVPSLNATCPLGPVDIKLSTEHPGGQRLDPSTLDGTVTAQGFSVPAVTTSPTCDATAAAAVNQFASLPTTETATTLHVTLSSDPRLASTGSATALGAVGGLAMVAAGAGLLGASRRRARR